MIRFWEDRQDGMKATCEWQDGEYTVTVSKGSIVKTEKFGQTFTPTFGMDIADSHQSQVIAEKLAKEIEAGI